MDNPNEYVSDLILYIQLQNKNIKQNIKWSIDTITKCLAMGAVIKIVHPYFLHKIKIFINGNFVVKKNKRKYNNLNTKI